VRPRAGSARRNPATRLRKPFDSTACVEVWAGDSLTINEESLGQRSDQPDTSAGPGGSTGASWLVYLRADSRHLELKTGTLTGLLKQAGVSVEQFVEALR
jgi:hypothetical protein